MAYIHGIVYDPPASGFPHIAVMFDTRGEVLCARVVSSREEGEQLIQNVAADFVAAKNAGKIK